MTRRGRSTGGWAGPSPPQLGNNSLPTRTTSFEVADRLKLDTKNVGTPVSATSAGWGADGSCCDAGTGQVLDLGRNSRTRGGRRRASSSRDVSKGLIAHHKVRRGSSLESAARLPWWRLSGSAGSGSGGSTGLSDRA